MILAVFSNLNDFMICKLRDVPGNTGNIKLEGTSGANPVQPSSVLAEEIWISFTGPCAVKSQVLPRMEISQPFWADASVRNRFCCEGVFSLHPTYFSQHWVVAPCPSPVHL